MDNLLLNAIRHGRSPITVRAERGDGQVAIRVLDSGPGVEEGVRSKLFERFAAGGTTGGTGLGLYLVREIARMHGGEVRYESPEQGGASQFVLTLPATA